jgi:hypothetical protein
MYIAELITLAIARLSRLDQIRSSAAQAGDVVQLAEIDRQIVDTQSTIDKLNTL